jgi:hypothetical protein
MSNFFLFSQPEEEPIPMEQDENPYGEPQDQLERIFKYERGMVIFNTDQDTIDYFQTLYQLHSLIDEKHDQLAGNRGDDLKSKDMIYKRKLITAINYSTLGTKQHFSTGVTQQTMKKFNIDSGIHTLQESLERLGDSFLIKIENGPVISAPTLPSLQILPWNCDRVPIPNELANSMVVYKNFNTDASCTNEKSGNLVKLEIGIQSTGFVHDTGSSEIFQRITAQGTRNGETRNIVSGKLDSSTTGGILTNFANNEYLQTLIPFMNIYDIQGALIGAIMIYVAPIDINRDGTYKVFIAFKFFDLTQLGFGGIYVIPEMLNFFGKTRTVNIDFTRENGWQTYTIENQVPNLPEISEYMAGVKGCFSAILKSIFKNTPLENKCKPYKEIAIRLWQIINGGTNNGGTNNGGTIFGIDNDLFVMAFLMKVKWLGDLFRLIDSFLLTESNPPMPTATATIDTFMKRFACLANLYVYCANKGGDLTINDVKTLTPTQIAELKESRAALAIREREEQVAIETQMTKAKIDRIKTKIAWYRDLMTQLTTFYTANWIPEFVNLILFGILNKDNIKIGELRVSKRLINIIVGCLKNQAYNYGGVTFQHKEMQSILDYFLTLIYYHRSFIFLFNQNFIEKMTLIFGKVLSVDNITVIEAEIISIDEIMNIMEKYNNISKIKPKYLDFRDKPRVLFDDSEYFLSKNVADMSTVNGFFANIQQFRVSIPELLPGLDDNLTMSLQMLPELNYEPSVGETIKNHYREILSSFGITYGGDGPRYSDRNKKPTEEKKRKEKLAIRQAEQKSVRRQKFDERRKTTNLELLMNKLHETNESLFNPLDEVGFKQILQDTKSLNDKETDLLAEILNSEVLKNKNELPNSYDDAFVSFESLVGMSNSGIGAIKTESSNFENVSFILQQYSNYDEYVAEYNILIGDIDEVNIVYTSIFNEVHIEEFNLYSRFGYNIERDFLATQDYYPLINKPRLYGEDVFYNQQLLLQQQQLQQQQLQQQRLQEPPFSVFRNPFGNSFGNPFEQSIPVNGGSTSKKKRTKKKTIKRKKKNTRKNRKTKGKPST